MLPSTPSPSLSQSNLACVCEVCEPHISHKRDTHRHSHRHRHTIHIHINTHTHSNMHPRTFTLTTEWHPACRFTRYRPQFSGTAAVQRHSPAGLGRNQVGNGASAYCKAAPGHHNRWTAVSFGLCADGRIVARLCRGSFGGAARIPVGRKRGLAGAQSARYLQTTRGGGARQRVSTRHE